MSVFCSIYETFVKLSIDKGKQRISILLYNKLQYNVTLVKYNLLVFWVKAGYKCLITDY